MLNYKTPLDGAFHALADPTRRRMVEQLAQGPCAVSALARPLTISLPAVMQHLAILEASGLVQSQKAGRVRTCRLNPKALGRAEEWLNQRRLALGLSLDRLGAYLERMDEEDVHDRHK